MKLLVIFIYLYLKKRLPEGLENVSGYPRLFEFLAADTSEPWTENELQKLAGLNLLRVLREVERVSEVIISQSKKMGPLLHETIIITVCIKCKIIFTPCLSSHLIIPLAPKVHFIL
jgi:hypothetical protein